jgi:hypothetical protein
MNGSSGFERFPARFAAAPTVNFVVIALVPTLTVEGLNVQVIPAGARQLKVTAPVNPSCGATVSVTSVERPRPTMMEGVCCVNWKTTKITTTVWVEELPWRASIPL